MKLSLLYTVLFYTFAFLAFLKPVRSCAQEFESAASDSIKTGATEETLYSVDDERSIDRPSTLVKDSVFFKSTHHQNHQRAKTTVENSAKVEKHKGEKDDSIMSFNFLYYMIKRFKLSDIVDKE